MFCTYVLYSEKHDRIYEGQTNGLQKRLNRYDSGLIKTTKPYHPFELLHFEEFDTHNKSRNHEKESMSHKGRDYIGQLISIGRVQQLLEKRLSYL